MPKFQLSSVTYAEFENDDRYWKLDGLELGQINLIVGKNATGKTRCLNVINGLGKTLAGKVKELYVSGAYDATFQQGDVTHRYQLQLEANRVILERYDIGDENMLRRSRGGIGYIHLTEENREQKFQTPDIQLATVARRDSIQHPFLETLHKWGSAAKHLEGGKEMGQTSLLFVLKEKIATEREHDHVASYFKEGMTKHGDKFKGAIIDDMKAVGYALEEIDLRKPENVATVPPISGDMLVIAVKERELKCWTSQLQMSQGMYRALAHIVHLNHVLLSGEESCFIIDDVGEGLDHERSCALIEVLRSKVIEASSQLIMTTNNRFVNSVPLEEWSVLQREGGLVRVRNYRNSRDVFEDFKFTGLSNFSFLETDYISGPRAEETPVNE